jgi:hypothetical protein
MTDFYPDEPWGMRLWRWRTEIVCWSQQDLVDRIVNDAYKNEEGRGTRLDTRLVSKWENGVVRRPQAVYQRILRRLGAPLPSPRGRSATSLAGKHRQEALSPVVSGDGALDNGQNEDGDQESGRVHGPVFDSR